MDFYKWVMETCRGKKIELKDMLNDLGIIYGTYKSVSRYKHLPRADDILKIAKYLGASFEYLLEDRDHQKAPFFLKSTILSQV